MEVGRRYPESVETERLRLDRFRPEDEDAVVAVWATGDIWRWLRPGTVYDEGIARLAFERHRQHWDEYGFGLWAVREAPTERLIGWIGASHPNWLPQLASEVELGWTLLPERRGRGLALEAAAAAREAAFDSLPIGRVISLIATDNARSAAVAKALGMRTSETVRHPTLGATLDVWELRRPVEDGAP